MDSRSIYAVCSAFVFLAVVFSGGVSCATAHAEEDHPAVSRYEGSVLKDKRVEDFGRYKLVSGLSDKGEFSTIDLEGKMTRIVYENPGGRSTFEIYSNYQKALEKAGFVRIHACALEECGPAYARSSWNRINGLFAAADGDPYYISGKIAKGSGEIFVALMVGRHRTQLDVVEIKGMEDNMVIAGADALAKGIDQDGKVSVYGIYFDTDKSVVKPESKAALDEIAKLLTDRQELNVYIVGHTDMSGSLSHNRSLSEARARAVAGKLVEQYKISPSRLEGHGVGPLAPAAENITAGGRAKNRRVEIVRRQINLLDGKT